MKEIHYLEESHVPQGPDIVEYVGGPRGGTTEALIGRQPPAVIFVTGVGDRSGHYLRSVRCADDHALRYIWNEE